MRLNTQCWPHLRVRWPPQQALISCAFYLKSPKFCSSSVSCHLNRTLSIFCRRLRAWCAELAAHGCSGCQSRSVWSVRTYQTQLLCSQASWANSLLSRLLTSRFLWSFRRAACCSLTKVFSVVQFYASGEFCLFHSPKISLWEPLLVKSRLQRMTSKDLVC